MSAKLPAISVEIFHSFYHYFSLFFSCSSLPPSLTYSLFSFGKVAVVSGIILGDTRAVLKSQLCRIFSTSSLYYPCAALHTDVIKAPFFALHL